MTNPYLRAAAKYPHIRQQARERLGKFRADNPTTTDVNEAWVEIDSDNLHLPKDRRPS